MSLLDDAAHFEDRRWRRRLASWRQDAAILYLKRVGTLLGGLVLLFLLIDGCRRDLAHGSGTVRAFQLGASLQTSRGSLSPCFLGQSVAVGDTVQTDGRSTVTIAFTDGTVLHLLPDTQVQLVQSEKISGKIVSARTMKTAGATRIHRMFRSTHEEAARDRLLVGSTAVVEVTDGLRQILTAWPFRAGVLLFWEPR